MQPLIYTPVAQNIPDIGWTPKERSQEAGVRKMQKCFQLTLRERTETESRSTLTWNEFQNMLHPQDTQDPLFFSYKTVEKRGARPYMEDVHLCIPHPNGLLAAVFDGHGGRDVAVILKDFFENNFFPTLEANQGDVHKTFQELFFTISSRVYLNEGAFCGSTAVVSYLSSAERMIFTATVGDSHANIYRKIDNKLRSIPLSRDLNWAHPKEAERAERALGLPGLKKKWIRNKNPKQIRFPGTFEGRGVNVSRAIGDAYFNRNANSPGVFSKPSITCCKLYEGDYVTLVSDGIKDFIPEDKIVEILELFAASSKEVSQIERIAFLALALYESKDNITGIGINV